MNRKKGKIQKVLLRNTDQKIGPTIVVEQNNVEILPIVTPLTNSNPKFGYSRHSGDSNRFAAPEFNTTLRVYGNLKKTQQNLQKPRRVKSVNDLKETERKIIEDKAVKKVNFPTTEPIYKDLIALEITPTELVHRTTVPSTQNREIWSKKDIEPKLKDFCRLKQKAEYSVIVDNYVIDNPPFRKYNGLTLHRTMQSWKYDSEHFSRL